MELLLIRHAESTANVGHSTDPNCALTENGIGQAQRLADLLAEQNLRAFTGLTSPYERATQTASQIARKTGLSFAIDEGVREWGVATAVNGQFFPAESAEQLIERLKDVLRRHKGQNLVVVSHAAPIAVMTQLAWGERPNTQGPFWEGISNCCLRWLKATCGPGRAADE